MGAADDEDARPTVSELLRQPRERVVAFLGGVYEHSPWAAEGLVAEAAAGGGPGADEFARLREAARGDGDGSAPTVTRLAAALRAVVDAAPREQKLALLRAHPDLCEKVARLRSLSPESQAEQSASGLQSLTAEEAERFQRMNAAYRTRFGFPFILAVRNATKHTVLAALEGRGSRPVEEEFAAALVQVHKIAFMRLLTKLDLSDAQGFLTCHVLDTANGCPAAKMKIQLHRLSPPESAGLVGEFVTNDDGRLNGGPALKGGAEFLVGTYEWIFFAGDYFARMGTYTSGTPFLDTIPIRFGIDNPDDHYHVPLLVSPWSFSTYRGS